MSTVPPDDRGAQPPTPPPPPPAQPPPPSGPAPPPPPPAYSPQAGGSGYQTGPKTNGLAIASLVLGIAGLVFYACGVASILAVVFGFMARNQIDNSGETQSGRGMAIAGIIMGWIGIALLVIFWVIVIIAVIVSDDDNNSSTMLQYALSA